MNFRLSWYGETLHYTTATEAITHALRRIVIFQRDNAPEAAHACVFSPNGDRIASTEPLERQGEICLSTLAAFYADGDYRN